MKMKLVTESEKGACSALAEWAKGGEAEDPKSLPHHVGSKNTSTTGQLCGLFFNLYLNVGKNSSY